MVSRGIKIITSIVIFLILMLMLHYFFGNHESVDWYSILVFVFSVNFLLIWDLIDRGKR